MHTVRVGALYHPEITTWPETPHWRLSEDGVELLLSYRDPTPMEITQVQRNAEIDNWYTRYGTVAELVRAAHVRT